MGRKLDFGIGVGTIAGLILLGRLENKPRQAGNELVHTGEDGDSPADLTTKGWRLALKQTGKALKDKDLARSAAALAYYATLTFFPALAGLATVVAIFAGKEMLFKILDGLRLVVPEPIAVLLQTQLAPITKATSTSLGIATVVTIAALLWTTSGGLQNLIKATNTAYDTQETRGLIKMRLMSVVMSIILLVLGAVTLGLLILQPTALHAWGFPDLWANLFPILRWPVLAVIISIALAFIYRYAPNRREPRWQWVSWGAAAATIIWLIGTVLFFLYVQYFANFNKTYGTFAGIIILMTWFNLSSLIILLGAQVNQRLEAVTPKKHTQSLPGESGKVVIKVFWLASIIISLLVTIALNVLFWLFRSH
jgi:membrane protein